MTLNQQQHTNIQAAVLHLSPVLQVHGPHVAIKQARRVGDSVLPCTENDNRELERRYFSGEDGRI